MAELLFASWRIGEGLYDRWQALASTHKAMLRGFGLALPAQATQS
jgi:hypothetical protein